jgi:thioredoxin reductase
MCVHRCIISIEYEYILTRAILIAHQVQLDADGYVLTGSNVAHPSSPLSAGDGGTAATAPASSPFSTMTSMAGVFACGDLVDKYYRYFDILTAVGSVAHFTVKCT